MTSSVVYVRWSVLTQIALRYTYFPHVSATRIQVDGKQRSRQESARVFSTTVMVPFNQKHGEPLGSSVEPYVSKPLRTPAFVNTPDIANHRKDPVVWGKLCALFQRVDGLSQEILIAYLAYCFSVLRGEATMNQRRLVQLRNDVSSDFRSADSLSEVLSKFIEPKTEGRRVQLTIAAILAAFAGVSTVFDDIKTNKTTASDASTSSLLDVDCFSSSEVVWSVETKDRDLDPAYLRGKVKKLYEKIQRPESGKNISLLFLAHKLPDSSVREEVFKEATAYGIDCRYSLIENWIPTSLSFLDVSERVLLLERLVALVAEHGTPEDVQDLKFLLEDG